MIINWHDGTPMSGASKIFVLVVIISAGLVIIDGRAGLFFPIGFVSLIIGSLLLEADRRRQSAGPGEQAGGNARKYPTAFKAPPAVKSSRELPHQDSFSIYDNETADCLGTLTYP